MLAERVREAAHQTSRDTRIAPTPSRAAAGGGVRAVPWAFYVLALTPSLSFAASSFPPEFEGMFTKAREATSSVAAAVLLGAWPAVAAGVMVAIARGREKTHEWLAQMGRRLRLSRYLVVAACIGAAVLLVPAISAWIQSDDSSTLDRASRFDSSMLSRFTSPLATIAVALSDAIGFRFYAYRMMRLPGRTTSATLWLAFGSALWWTGFAATSLLVDAAPFAFFSAFCWSMVATRIYERSDGDLLAATTWSALLPCWFALALAHPHAVNSLLLLALGAWSVRELARERHAWWTERFEHIDPDVERALPRLHAASLFWCLAHVRRTWVNRVFAALGLLGALVWVGGLLMEHGASLGQSILDTIDRTGRIDSNTLLISLIALVAAIFRTWLQNRVVLGLHELWNPGGLERAREEGKLTQARVSRRLADSRPGELIASIASSVKLAIRDGFRIAYCRSFDPVVSTGASIAVVPALGCFGKVELISNAALAAAHVATDRLVQDLDLGDYDRHAHFGDESWRKWIEQAAASCDCAVIDVTRHSPHVAWEIEVLLGAMPRDRVVLCAAAGSASDDAILRYREEVPALREPGSPPVLRYRPTRRMDLFGPLHRFLRNLTWEAESPRY